MDIMDFFPYDTPRKSQREVLEEIQDSWDSTDVFVVRVPVAGGKSAIATTIQDFSLKQKLSAAITVPNNMLRTQYLEEFDWLHTIKNQGEYYLPRFGCTVRDFMSRYNVKYGPKGCQYNEDRKVVRRVGSPIVMNYMGYQAHKLFRNVLVVDEAHQLLNTLRDMHGLTLWKHKIKYPDEVFDTTSLILWLESLPSLSTQLTTLYSALTSPLPTAIIEFGSGIYRGEAEECIRIKPMDVSEAAPIFWPPKTSKIILMSATISESDVDFMGLGSRTVKYIDAESEIPEDRRPIVYKPVGSLSRKNLEKNLPALVRSITDILRDHPDSKGFIHATYGMAEILKKEVDNDRMIFHTKDSKRDLFKQFLESDPKDAKVFVGSGMTEGIDLAHGLGSFQIITKIPFPSLADPTNRYLATHSPSDYLWATTKELLQASGRICRAPDDYGITYILDSDCDLWLPKAQKFKQIPKWFNVRGDTG